MHYLESVWNHAKSEINIASYRLLQARLFVGWEMSAYFQNGKRRQKESKDASQRG